MLRPVSPTFGQVESGSRSLAISLCSKAQFHSTPLQIVSDRRSPRNVRALGQRSRCTALHWVPSPHHNTDLFASGHKLSSFHNHQRHTQLLGCSTSWMSSLLSVRGDVTCRGGGCLTGMWLEGETGRGREEGERRRVREEVDMLSMHSRNVWLF